MAYKTILGQVIIWHEKNDRFDKTKITNIKNDELKYWGEIEEITPPVKKFSNGDPTEICNWYRAKILTNTEKEALTPPQICSGIYALSKVLDSTPENISFRWK